VLKLDMSKLGFLSSLPYVVMWFLATGTGQLADYARDKGVRTIVVRKVCQCGGQLISAAGLIALAYVPDGPNTETISIIMLSISLGAAGIPLSGFNVNHLDIAPKYAGVLMGITNTFATIPGFVAPQLTDSMTTADPKTHPDELKAQWRNVFFIAAGVYSFGVVFYLVFASGDKQPWAEGKPPRRYLGASVN